MGTLNLQKFADFDWKAQAASLQAASKLDSRFRITLPRDLREQFKDWIYVAPGFHKALYCFQPEQYNTWLATLEQARAGANAAEQALLDLMGYVVPLQLDGQKRFQLNDSFLREWAGLEEGEPYLITAGKGRLQLWALKQWQQRLQQVLAESESVDEDQLYRCLSAASTQVSVEPAGGSEAQ